MPEVRTLTTKEMRLLLPGAREFFGERQLMGKLNERHFVQTLQQYNELRSGFVVAKVENGVIHGALGAAISRDYATGDLTAVELFLFIRPEFRGGVLVLRLINAYEEQARIRGAKRVIIVHLVGEEACNLTGLYQRKGYSLKENLFAKEI